MLEIAGGILVAIAVLVALPFLLVGAYWAVVIGIGLAIVAGIWFGLETLLGEKWAWSISIVGAVIWLAWSDVRAADREKAKTEDAERKAKNQKAKALADEVKRTREQQARFEAWKAEEKARKERETHSREARIEKMKADRAICIQALRDGREVIGIDGRKKTLKDYKIYD